MKAIQWDKHFSRVGGGFDFYPYQIAFGISLRYWPCFSGPAFRVYFGPIKIWGYVKIKDFRGL